MAFIESENHGVYMIYMALASLASLCVFPLIGYYAFNNEYESVFIHMGQISAFVCWGGMIWFNIKRKSTESCSTEKS